MTVSQSHLLTSNDRSTHIKSLNMNKIEMRVLKFAFLLLSVFYYIKLWQRFLLKKKMKCTCIWNSLFNSVNSSDVLFNKVVKHQPQNLRRRCSMRKLTQGRDQVKHVEISVFLVKEFFHKLAKFYMYINNISYCRWCILSKMFDIQETKNPNSLALVIL